MPSPPQSRKSLVVSRRIRIPLDEFEWTFARSSGPGGQNVNKTSTKAQLRWKLDESPSLPDDVKQRFRTQCRRRMTKDGECLITSQRYRDQQKNVDDCLNKLRDLLKQAVTPPKKRKQTKPTRASKERRLRQKKQRGEKKKQRKPPKLDE